METEIRFKILIVDDEQDVCSAMTRFFQRLPYHLVFAENGVSALDHLARAPVDLVLLDLKMPGMDGLGVLGEALVRHPDLKVIMLTAHGGIEDAVAAIKCGALDFIEKSASPDVLRKKVAQVYRVWQLERENRSLQEKLVSQFTFDALYGKAPAMLKLKDMIVRIAPTDTSVLIQGESGAGKELVARALHHHSLRQDRVFMPVDCAAVNESIIESELFGHHKGAFTGAGQSAIGLVRAADGGTLFLDEVGELSLSMQAKLLRTIQERSVRPVGSVQTHRVDIRIIAATNRNLVDAVADKTFRNDLYYRLSGVTLQVPPLRERIEDIEILASHFVDQLTLENFAAKTIASGALDRLRCYPWPGNVRELENVIRSAMAFSSGETIETGDLSAALPATGEIADATPVDVSSISDYEERAIRDALAHTRGSRRKAARILGISEATLYRRLKRYGI